jgi:hypothetical protein
MAAFLRIKCAARYPAGPAWAALDDHQLVLNAISKKAPPRLTGPDYEAFRDNARKALAALGRLVSGDIVYEGEDCFFVRDNSRQDASRQRRVMVDLQAAWAQYQPSPLEGWTFLGVVSSNGVIGALGHHAADDSYALVVAGDPTPLDAGRVRTALHQARQRA